MKSILFGILFLTSILRGDDLLLDQARKAIDSGISQAGIFKLQQFLSQPRSDAESSTARLELVKVYLSIGDTSSAEKILTTLPSNEESDFLSIQLALAQQRWLDALAKIEKMASQESKFYARNVFARGEAQRALGKNDLAAENYRLIEDDPMLGGLAHLRLAELTQRTNPAEFIPPSFKNQDDLEMLQFATLLKAQSLFALKDFDGAERIFQTLIKNPKKLDSSSYATAYLGLTRCLNKLNRADEASDLLEAFIESRPRHPALEEIFRELDQSYRNQNASSQTRLRQWSRDSLHPERQAHSVYYQAQSDLRDKGSDAANATLSSWLTKFPKHPLRANVLLNYAQRLVLDRKWSQAIEQLNEGLALVSQPSIKGRLYVVAADALFEQSQFVNAAERFTQATEWLGHSNDTLLYNAALCALRAADLSQFNTIFEKFQGLFPGNPLSKILLVESGYLKARQGDFNGARSVLNTFVNEYRQDARVPAVYLALAEISMGDAPDVSQNQLKLASQNNPNNDVVERSAYLELLNNKDGENNAGRIAKFEEFLGKYPNSQFEAEVCFKLGEIFFSEKNYSAAGGYFKTISTRFPESPLLEQARFLAAQSAIRTMNPNAIDGAILLFEQVVSMKGPLQAYARLEQASVKKNSGAYNEALVLLNDLLDQNPTPDLLSSTLAEKGDTLYLQGSTDLKNVSESVDTFNRLATIPGISQYWRNLALYKRGKGLGWLGKKDEMLTSFYDTLTQPNQAGETPEYYWSSRAGFDAAETLEADGQWKSAIGIYRKLVEAKVPRAKEASERIDRLRLEHFIWD